MPEAVASREGARHQGAPGTAAASCVLSHCEGSYRFLPALHSPRDKRGNKGFTRKDEAEEAALCPDTAQEVNT